jgi:hypothetical protein
MGRNLIITQHPSLKTVLCIFHRSRGVNASCVDMVASQEFETITSLVASLACEDMHVL